MAWQQITINKEVVRRFTNDELGNMYCVYASASGVVNSAGILKSIDKGQNWVDITPRTQITDTWKNMEDIKFANGVLIATIRRDTSTTSFTIIRSTDRGATWSLCSPTTAYNYVDPCRLEYLGGNDWLCTELNAYDSYSSVLKSINNGLTWTRVSVVNIPGQILSILKTLNGDIYISHTGNSKIYKSINNGSNWVEFLTLNYPATEIKEIDNQLYFTISSSNLTNEKIVKSTFAGVLSNFSNFTVVNSIETVYDIVKIAENIFICATGNTTGDGDIWKTEDNGTTWTKEEMGVQYEYFMYPYLFEGRLYVGSGKDAGDGQIWIYTFDTTPPSFNSVSIDTITYNSANLNVNSNEDGKVYYKILPRNATAPTSAELKANPTGQTNVTANITSIIPITALTPITQYDCYVVAEDTVPNLQLTPTKIQFQTIKEDFPPNTIYKTGSVYINSYQFSILSDEDCKSYYEIYLSSLSQNPTSQYLKENSTNETIYAYKDSIKYISKNSLSEDTLYDLFVVSEDLAGHIQSSPYKITFKTLKQYIPPINDENEKYYDFINQYDRETYIEGISRQLIFGETHSKDAIQASRVEEYTVVSNFGNTTTVDKTIKAPLYIKKMIVPIVDGSMYLIGNKRILKISEYNKYYEYILFIDGSMEKIDNVSIDTDGTYLLEIDNPQVSSVFELFACVYYDDFQLNEINGYTGLSAGDKLYSISSCNINKNGIRNIYSNKYGIKLTESFFDTVDLDDDVFIIDFNADIIHKKTQFSNLVQFSSNMTVFKRDSEISFRTASENIKQLIEEKYPALDFNNIIISHNNKIYPIGTQYIYGNYIKKIDIVHTLGSVDFSIPIYSFCTGTMISGFALDKIDKLDIESYSPTSNSEYTESKSVSNKSNILKNVKIKYNLELRDSDENKNIQEILLKNRYKIITRRCDSYVL